MTGPSVRQLSVRTTGDPAHCGEELLAALEQEAEARRQAEVREAVWAALPGRSHDRAEVEESWRRYFDGIAEHKSAMTMAFVPTGAGSKKVARDIGGESEDPRGNRR